MKGTITGALLLWCSVLNAQIHTMSVTLMLVKSLPQVEAMCGAHSPDPLVVHGWVGCAVLNGQNCLIIALPPTDWADADRMIVLGHELWHCTGKRHD